MIKISVRPSIQGAIHTLGKSTQKTISFGKDSTMPKFFEHADDMVNIQRDIESRLGKGVDLKYEICKTNVLSLYYSNKY